jgi:hypothetical protein
MDKSGTLARTVAKQALLDVDLAALNLGGLPPPNSSTMKTLGSIRASVEEFIPKGVAAGVHVDEIDRFVALYVRSKAI